MTDVERLYVTRQGELIGSFRPTGRGPGGARTVSTSVRQAGAGTPEQLRDLHLGWLPAVNSGLRTPAISTLPPASVRHRVGPSNKCALRSGRSKPAIASWPARCELE